MTRVMAAVAPQPGLEPLIERAAAGARRAEGKLVVVSVDSSEGKGGDAPDATHLYQEMTLRLGGQFVVLKSTKPGQALLEYAKRTHVTEIVLARGDHKEKAGPLGSSIKRDIIRGASLIDVHVLRSFDTQGELGTAPETHSAHEARLTAEAAAEKGRSDGTKAGLAPDSVGSDTALALPRASHPDSRGSLGRVWSRKQMSTLSLSMSGP
jgi:K+-sensing histidine kinase KdpD